ncbi:MAG: hypothetical protein IKH69_01625, partial [Bacteroidaceae bacterium]|nr:hypothetical protein [Bacteroidaceae bacterium]
PEEAKRQMIFKLTANSVLDMVMDSLSPETAEEVAQCIDGYIGVGIVNKKFGIDLYKELYEALSKVEQKESGYPSQTPAILNFISLIPIILNPVPS